MPLTVENGAALVPGAALTTKTRLVRVTRPFMAGDQRQEVGSELELPALFAAEMVGAGKAEFFEPEPQPDAAIQSGAKPTAAKQGKQAS